MEVGLHEQLVGCGRRRVCKHSGPIAEGRRVRKQAKVSSKTELLRREAPVDMDLSEALSRQGADSTSDSGKGLPQNFGWPPHIS